MGPAPRAPAAPQHLRLPFGVAGWACVTHCSSRLGGGSRSSRTVDWLVPCFFLSFRRRGGRGGGGGGRGDPCRTVWDPLASLSGSCSLDGCRGGRVSSWLPRPPSPLVRRRFQWRPALTAAGGGAAHWPHRVNGRLSPPPPTPLPLPTASPRPGACAATRRPPAAARGRAAGACLVVVSFPSRPAPFPPPFSCPPLPLSHPPPVTLSLSSAGNAPPLPRVGPEGRVPPVDGVSGRPVPCTSPRLRRRCAPPAIRRCVCHCRRCGVVVPRGGVRGEGHLLAATLPRRR